MGGLLGALIGGTGHAVAQLPHQNRSGLEYPELQPNLNPNDPYLQPQTPTSPGNANGRPERKVGYQGFLESLLGPNAHSDAFLASTLHQSPPVAPAQPMTQGWSYVAGKGPEWLQQDPFGKSSTPNKPFTGNRI